MRISRCRAQIIYRGSFGGVHTAWCDLPNGHEGPHTIEPFFDEDLHVEIGFQWVGGVYPENDKASEPQTVVEAKRD